MLNNRKIRLMTQLAIYEKNDGREDIKLSHYYSSDYARLQVLKTAITTTICYLAIVGMVGLYKLEYLLDNALTLDYKSMGWTILGIYIAVMTVYLICTLLGYSLKYKLSRKKLGRYFRMLRRLKEMYAEEEGYGSSDGTSEYEEGEED